MADGARDRLFRGYGPLIGFAAIFLAVAVLVPSQQREVRVEAAGGSGSGSELSSDDASVAGATETVPGSETGLDATGASLDGTGAAGGTAGGGAGGANAKGGSNSGPPKVAGCGAAQIPGDPYSPPCVQFSGGNGGATSRGVTADKIVVSVRVGSFANGMLDALSKVANAKIPNESPQVITKTVDGLVEYFNKRFQFYGRKLEVVKWDGKGDVLKETTGGGQEGAQADALKVSQEIKAFADVSAVSPVYADALASKQVINIGVPFTSREWMTQRKPWSWSQFTDCSTVVESVASYYAIKLAGQPAALAGGDLKGQARRAMIIAPENSWYQECVRAGINILQKAGKAGDLVDSLKYQIDIPRMSDQAASLIQKLKAERITTVVCGCDPLLLTFLTSKAKEQNYQPEWVITGIALIDNDMIGQILQQDQWGRAFGVSFSGPTQAAGQGLGYRAYKSVRPDEPSVGVELIYNQLYLLAIGIQGAGPNLNPQTFEKAMFDYPRRSGPSGTWGFGPGDYTTSDDAREVFWNPSVASVQTRSPGTYQDPNGGKRFPIGQWPNTPPRSALG
ncbi:MAG TPA: ABC transporter substrate-binding protein [Microthrixaceae bacterium]|nr:ABC transporter substrate-binding protein [Microthrixaceae bacterium]HMV74202.1 ABC transporter substrate-binding protein [Microthrixaceae bacterium]HMY88259.1 ABC transporter substrate-binding protein [Microthrixaceae bacterium]HNA36859.1 ABC transporter substrate-binding protein [Microthrixaceae bacterium]HNB94244.1 ABC transporter substrate-binding protein [Microthrixaceae bacterium]